MKFLNRRVNNFWLPAIFSVGLFGFALFYLLPFLLGFYYSFFDLLDGRRFVGLANYADLFSSELFRMAMINTLIFTFLSLALAFVCSFGAAYLLRFSMLGRVIPRKLLFLPIAVPAVSISFVWMWLFHHRGFVSGFFDGIMTLNLFHGAWLYVPLLVLFLWRYSGFGILVYFAGLSRLPEEYLDAFRIESKSRAKLLWYVLLPHEKPRTVYLLLLNMLFSGSIFREIFAVWANYPPRQLYMIQHFVYNNFMRLQYERAATGGVILSFIVLACLAGILFWEKRGIE